MTGKTDGPRVADFVETFCRFSKGEWSGQPFQLRPWQRDLLDGLFTLRPDGRRKHRVGLVGFPRKNGKSTLGAALALYGLVADNEPGAEVYSCAGDRKQAEIVFSEAKRMVQMDPELSQFVKVQRYHLEVPSTHAVYRVLSADATLQQGLNASMVVFDEVHVQPNDDLWTAMTLGSGTRRQPLVVGITTAGYDEDSLAYRLYEYGQRVNGGEIDDPTFFFRWWEPTHRECDYRDPAVWAEANPAYGDFLKEEDFEATCLQTPEFEFRRYRLNQWVKTAVAWLPFGAWDRCRDAARELNPALPVKVGIDMAHSNDAAAVAIAQRQGDKTVVRARIWENPYLPNHSEHSKWTINPFEVEEHCRELYRRFPAPSCEIDGQVKAGPEFAYDPAWFSRSAPVLAGEGLAMVAIPQSDQRMIPACQTMYQVITEGQLVHDGDPALKRHVENAVVDRKERGWRITKAHSRKKIDGAVAATIAVYKAQEPAPVKRRSAYADGHGLMVAR